MPGIEREPDEIVRRLHDPRVADVRGRLVDLSMWLGALETVSRDFH